MKNLGKVVPACSNGGGNTKTPPKPKVNPAKNWCFTLNNYTEKDICSIENIVKTYCKYAIIGREVGDQGTSHLQGYIEFKRKDRPLNKKYEWSNKIHWEKAIAGRKENKEYCCKDGKYWEYPKPYSIDIELYKWQEEIWEILNQEPDDRTIYWVWGENGCEGKTVFQKYIYTRLKKNTVILSGKCNDMKNGVVEYLKNNHCLPEVVLVNIPRVNQNHVSISGLEQIKDMFFYSGKYEGGMICGKNPHVIVFANEPVEYGVLSKDRVIEMDITIAE